MATNNDAQIMLQTMQLATNNLNVLSDQMGLVNARLNDHESRLNEMQAETQSKFDDVTHRLEVRERREILNNSQRRQMRNAVRDRVYLLLEIEFEDGKMTKESRRVAGLYRSGFFSKCYSDAKRFSLMADEFVDTLAINYDEVMEYIESWVPENYGIDGYKEYLDDLRKARSGKK